MQIALPMDSPGYGNSTSYVQTDACAAGAYYSFAINSVLTKAYPCSLCSRLACFRSYSKRASRMKNAGPDIEHSIV